MHLIAFDLETTGLNPTTDSIVEIGAVRFDPRTGEIGDSFQTLVNPMVPIPEKATAIHGIRDCDVATAPTVRESLDLFVQWHGPGRQTLVAHNAKFDRGFLEEALLRVWDRSIAYLWLDTLAPARQRYGRLAGGSSLGGLAKYHGFDDDQSHRALADARRVARLYLLMSPPLKMLA